MNKPECKINKDGTKEWYLNNKLHREDGPALEYPTGTKRWYLNGKYHREEGPATEYREVSFYGVLTVAVDHSETIVDLWLSRGVFCWYDETNDCLNFVEKDEQA